MGKINFLWKVEQSIENMVFLVTDFGNFIGLIQDPNWSSFAYLN